MAIQVFCNFRRRRRLLPVIFPVLWAIRSRSGWIQACDPDGEPRSTSMTRLSSEMLFFRSSSQSRRRVPGDSGTVNRLLLAMGAIGGGDGTKFSSSL